MHMANVLVVEDEPLLLTLLSGALERSGHTVITAESGEEALKVVQRDGETISVVVADFSMPDISGIELLRAARIFRPERKAILVSGYWIGASRYREISMSSN
jgi:two-component system, cell cycle sensor histidine kinase and response regulator CckA